VCRGRCAQPAGEGKLAVVVEVVLLAEEDHLVLQQRAVDRRYSLGVEIADQPHTVNAGADVRAQFHHVKGSRHVGMVRHVDVVRHGLNGCDSKPAVTAATLRCVVILATQVDQYPAVGR